MQFTVEEDAVPKSETESWEGPYSTYDGSWKKFLSRSVSHICAPGFFLLLGISMVLFTSSRRELLGWSWLRITAHHFLRGALFLLVDYVFDFAGVLPQLVDLIHGRTVTDSHGNKYGKGDEGKVIYHALFALYRVMTALGLSMMLLALLLPLFSVADYLKRGLGEVIGWLGFLLSFAVSTVAIVVAQGDENLMNPPKEYPHRFHVVHNVEETLGRVFLYPGHLFRNWEMITYPVFPWIGIAFVGMGCGFALKRTDPHSFHRRLRIFSVLAFTAFFCIRLFGGRLNYRGRQRGEDIGGNAWIAFFTQTKYPPDLAFASITLGVLFLLLSFFGHSAFQSFEAVIEGGDDTDTSREADLEDKRDIKFFFCALKKEKCLHLLLHPIVVFGKNPLFFYVTHKYIIQSVEAMFRVPSEPVGRFRLGVVIAAWILLLFLMFGACVLFHRYRTSPRRPDVFRHL